MSYPTSTFIIIAYR